MGAFTPNLSRLVTAFAGKTATFESNAIAVEGAKKITLAMTRADHSSGSSAFSVTGTVDGTNYVALKRLIPNITNAIAENLTRVASVSLGANGSELLSIDLKDLALLAIKVKVTETTDGTHSAKVLIQT